MSRQSIVAPLALSVVAGLSACDYLPGIAMTDESHGALAACEEVVKTSLRSPSTYQRISAEFTLGQPLTFEEYVSYQETKGCPQAQTDPRECLANNLALGYGATVDFTHPSSTKQVRPFSRAARTAYLRHLFGRYQARPPEQQETAFVQIEYDAVNAYNAPIRSTHICRFGPRMGERYSSGDMFY